MDGGVRLKHIVLDPEHWDLVEIQGSTAKAWSWFVEHEDDRYDLLGLLGFVWRRQLGDKFRWFCSEAVVAAALGFPEPYRFDPMTLYSTLTGAKP